MRSCVLFDFDGVLVDSEWLAFCQTQTLMAERYGVGLQAEDCRRYSGGTEERMARSLVERFALPVTPQALCAELSAASTLYESDALTLMPGARDFLLRLRRQGVRTGLVSSTASRHILSTANRLGLVSLMDVILCGDMVRRHKPDPEGYRTAMALLRAAPEECVILEVSRWGCRPPGRPGRSRWGSASRSCGRMSRRPTCGRRPMRNCAARLSGRGWTCRPGRNRTAEVFTRQSDRPPTHAVGGRFSAGRGLRPPKKQDTGRQYRMAGR